MTKIEITTPEQKGIKNFSGLFLRHKVGSLWFLFCNDDRYNLTKLETGEVYSTTDYSYEEILTIIENKYFELLDNGTEIKITVENNNE